MSPPDDSDRPLGAIPEPTDWVEIDHVLMENCGFTPHQINQMTLPEIFVACGVPKMSEADAWLNINTYKTLTPQQRIRLHQFQAQHS